MKILKDVDKYLIEMSVSLLKSDLTSQKSKDEAKLYIEHILEKGSEAEKSYAFEKLNNFKTKELK